tara:strand:+ start:1033 stop:1191 length:159 start_codon:yes stop_codon:yes gene_type:complete
MKKVLFSIASALIAIEGFTQLSGNCTVNGGSANGGPSGSPFFFALGIIHYIL